MSRKVMTNYDHLQQKLKDAQLAFYKDKNNIKTLCINIKQTFI